MDDQQVGRALRAVRLKRRWRQADVAARAGVDPSLISRLEHGHLDRLSLAALRRIAAALDVRVEVVARWRGGELDRLVSARHGELHEQVARLLRSAGWEMAPEVSFSIFGERGVIDILAWHAATTSLLVIELKTAIVDVQELVGTLDRKIRLAPRIARERGWRPGTVSAWVVVADGMTNRRRIAAHRTMLRAAYPSDGRRMRAWLLRPAKPVTVLSMWPRLWGTLESDSPRPAGARVSGTAQLSVKRSVQSLPVPHRRLQDGSTVPRGHV